MFIFGGDGDAAEIIKETVDFAAYRAIYSMRPYITGQMEKLLGFTPANLITLLESKH